MLRRRFVKDRSGGCALKLPRSERALLGNLASELGAALEALAGQESPPEVPKSMRRLFPPAYVTDAAAEERYSELTREDLLSHHEAAFSVLAASAGNARLSDEEIEAWMAALTDLRLVLGTVLSVTDDGPPGAAGLLQTSQGVIYAYLSSLQEELVELVSGSLPPPAPGADDHVPEDPWGEPLGGLRWDGSPVPKGLPPDPPSGVDKGPR